MLTKTLLRVLLKFLTTRIDPFFLQAANSLAIEVFGVNAAFNDSFSGNFRGNVSFQSLGDWVLFLGT